MRSVTMWLHDCVRLTEEKQIVVRGQDYNLQVLNEVEVRFGV